MVIDLKRPVAPDPYSVLPPVPGFTLTSEDLTQGRPLKEPQTAQGGSISPQLSWSGFPDETKSFLLTCYDPDAPIEGGFWHWLVSDIPVGVTSIATGSTISVVRAVANRLFGASSSIGISEATDLPNSQGSLGYYGACPPKGDRVHRYFFAVHALGVQTLDLPHGRRTAPDLVAATAVPHILARAVLMGTYHR